MKSHFKTLTLVALIAITTNSFGRDIILIENQASASEGQMLMKIIQEKFNIPRKLITFKSINRECMKNSDSIMQLCLKPNGEMEIVRINKFVIENTFRVFLEAETI